MYKNNKMALTSSSSSVSISTLLISIHPILMCLLLNAPVTVDSQYLVEILERTALGGHKVVVDCDATGANFGEDVMAFSYGIDAIGCAVQSQTLACGEMILVRKNLKSDELNSTSHCNVNFAVVPRGNCSFSEKAYYVQNAKPSGYNALIVYNANYNDPITMAGSKYADLVHIPVVMVKYDCMQMLLGDYGPEKGYMVTIKALPGYKYDHELMKYLFPLVTIVGICFVVIFIALMIHLCRKRRHQANKKCLPPSYLQNIPKLELKKKDLEMNGDQLNKSPRNWWESPRTELVQAVLLYFPGGNGPCHFDNVFVGTLDLQALLPDAYRTGIKNSSARWNVLKRSKAIAEKFKNAVASSAQPNVLYHWYITYEALLDWFTDGDVKEAYLAYQIQHIRDLTGVRNGTAFMWSPGFQARPATMPDKTLLTANLRDFFQRLRQATNFNSYRNFGDPLWLVMQDHARPGGDQTKEDALVWFNFLRNNFGPFTSLEMNVEQFQVCTTGSLAAGTDWERTDRENFYVQKGAVPLGPAWELRFWMGSQPDC